MPPYVFRYDFFAVGQGLCAHGALGRHEYHPEFRWLYDCGTASAQGLIDAAMADLRRISNTLPWLNFTLDIAAVSHFDNDHISGLEKLVRQCRIKRLLLPYVPLWQRLVVAFAEGVRSRDRQLAFYFDPVSYIAGIPGADVEEIILVPGAGDATAGEGGGEGPPSGEGGEGPWTVEYPEAEPTSGDQSADVELFAQSHRNVRFLRAGGKLSVANIWEFVPYNDSDFEPPSAKLDAFRKDVAAKRARIVERQDGSAIVELKRLYESIYETAEARNVISLFLYAGPMKRQPFVTFRFRNSAPPSDYWKVLSGPPHHTYPHSSILYTGDGYLNPVDRLTKLVRFLGKPNRLEKLLVLQVMHHGAEANCCTGTAAVLDPWMSVFSSDPKRKRPGHPHANVLREFSAHRPIQVDTSKELVISGWILS